jgi:kinesin family protein C1
MWNEPNSALSVFVPAGPLSVRQDMGLHLLDMKRMIEELRYEKEALREDIIAWSSSPCLFGSSEMRVDSRISELECNKRIRDLLFQVNELKGKVKVVGRFRPLIEGERVALDFSIPNNSSVVINGCGGTDGGGGRVFELDEVFDADIDNESFYEKSKIKSVVESSVLISNNVCIFSYGQTNSGKTHTVIGSRGEKGIVELTLESIFGLLEEKREKKSVEIEMIEIYRESVFQLIECTNVESKNQTMEIFLEKVQDRATASTFLNPTSSRSHCVFIISLVSEKNTSYTHFSIYNLKWLHYIRGKREKEKTVL